MLTKLVQYQTPSKWIIIKATQGYFSFIKQIILEGILKFLTNLTVILMNEAYLFYSQRSSLTKVFTSLMLFSYMLQINSFKIVVIGRAVFSDAAEVMNIF